VGRRRRHAFRSLFGDERLGYRAAMGCHCREPTGPNALSDHVTAYATVHPWEDWAETFGDYLHIRDARQTTVAHAYRVVTKLSFVHDRVQELRARSGAQS
jgi:hypothetical protein